MSRLKDSIRILRHLSLQRVWNVFLLRLSFYLTRMTKKSFHFGLPASMSIEPTTACNLGCPECPSGLKQFTRPTGKLDLDLHKTLLSQIKSTVFYINYYFQGEPFLHPRFLELIKDAKRENIYTATSTNGHFIDFKKAKEIVASGLDRLIISVDGLTQETYEQYRINGSLEKVLESSLAVPQSDQNHILEPYQKNLYLFRLHNPFVQRRLSQNFVYPKSSFLDKSNLHLTLYFLIF